MVGFAAQEQQYNEQQAQYNQNYVNALSDNRLTEDTLQARGMENNQQYAQKDQLTLIQGAQKQATVKAAAATGGVSGNVVQSIVNGIGTQVNQARATLLTQWQANATQNYDEKQSAVSQEISRIGEVAAPFSPSPVGAVLGAVGGGLKFAGTSTGQSFFGSIGGGGGGGAGVDMNDAAMGESITGGSGLFEGD
jgi:hypothetical protein